MRHFDTSRLTALSRRRNTSRRPIVTRRPITAHRTIDPSRLTLLRRNSDAEESGHFRRNLVPFSVSTTGFWSNPDKKWGPSLYNPLEDKDHAFKDERHYQRTIAKLRRRNPSFRRNPIQEDVCTDCGLLRNPDELTSVAFCETCGEPTDRDCEGNSQCSTCDGPCMMCADGGYHRNPDYALRAVTGTNSATGSPGQGLFRSLFAGRRNPTQSIQTASNSHIGEGLFTSIFSRNRRNPISRWSPGNRNHSSRHRRWGPRRFDESSFYGV